MVYAVYVTKCDRLGRAGIRFFMDGAGRRRSGERGRIFLKDMSRIETNMERGAREEPYAQTRRYLRQLSRRNARIEALLERQRRYRELASGRTTRLREVGGGVRRRVSSVEEFVLKIVDLEREIDRRVDEYVDLTREIEARIDRLEDGRLRDLLRWRYVNEWDWERVAGALGYERRQAFRLHARALRAFEEVCREEENFPAQAKSSPNVT